MASLAPARAEVEAGAVAKADQNIIHNKIELLKIRSDFVSF